MKRRYTLATLFVVLTIAAIAIRVGMHLDPRVHIVGQVVSVEHRKPVRGVHVRVMTSATTGMPAVDEELVTDDNGRFKLENVEPGFYTIWIDDEAWVCRRGQLYLAEKGNKPVDRFQVSKGAKVSIRIYDATTGDPDTSFGSKVELKPVKQSVPGFTLRRRSSSDGVFDLVLCPGQTRLTFVETSNFDSILQIKAEEGERLALEFLVLNGRKGLHPLVRNAETGHAYAFLQASRIGDTFGDAVQFAESLTFDGMQGHLATITSGTEYRFVRDQHDQSFLPQQGSTMTTLLGATDEHEEGVWRWGCGPEKGHLFYRKGDRLDAFHAWGRDGFHQEPNNQTHISAGGENFLTWYIGSNRGWNDSARIPPSYLLVEFSPDRTPSLPKAKPLTAPDTTNHPNRIAAARVTWDEGVYRVFGFANRKWYVWESPETEPPRRNDGAHFVFSPSRIVLSTGWMLDLPAREWTRIPKIDNAHCFVGNKVLHTVRLGKGKAQLRLFDTDTAETTAVKARPPHSLSGARARLLHENRFFVWGATKVPNEETKTRQWGMVYDLTNDEWKTFTALRECRHVRLAAWQNKIVAWHRDSETNEWSGQLVDMATGEVEELPRPDPRGANIANICVVGDRLVCGLHPHDGGGMRLSIYDLRLRSWRQIESPFPNEWGGWLGEVVAPNQCLFGFPSDDLEAVELDDST